MQKKTFPTSMQAGEGLLGFREVSRTIESSTSFGQLLLKWRLFGEELDLKDEVLLDLQFRLSTGTYELGDLPRKILKIWKANQGTKATLQTLCEALENCGVRDIAEALTDKFSANATALTKRPSILVYGKVHELKQLISKTASKEVCQLVDEKFKSCPDTQIRLIREEALPKGQPEYYIQRTLSHKTELDEKLFKAESAKEDIFVVKGISRPDLARASGFQFIETSGNQLNKVTVRFIILEHEADFRKICTKTSKPVHLIDYKNQTFFWRRSSQTLDTIRNFLKNEGESFEETEAIKRIMSLAFPSSISISDSPGMGKSMVLANLATEIAQISPNSLPVLIVLQEFAHQMQSITSPSSAIEAVFTYASADNESKSILLELFEKNTFQLFLFLDGYDEVLQDKQDLTDSFLQIVTKIPNVKAIVTTRPHLQARLENLLHRISFEILPFNQSNQIEFLKRYWIVKHGAKEGKSLNTFAMKCLMALETKMTDRERNIAGVPLQCRMLAEVYGEYAKRASELENVPEDVVKEFSIFEMYKALIELKFSKYQDPQISQKYIYAHIYYSIALLFPEWLGKFKPHLGKLEDIDENTLYSIGLLEKNPSLSTPRFVHRTYAEYIFAGFIVDNLRKSRVFVEFLSQHIFGELGVSQIKELGKTIFYKLKHPVIAYFVNMHLQQYFKDDTSDFAFLRGLSLQNISEDDAGIAACSTCCYNLENCFSLITNIMQHLKIKNEEEMKNKYIKHLPHIVVNKTNNVALLQKVLSLSKLRFGVDLCFHKHQGYRYSFDNHQSLSRETPLHVAVYKGKYNMVMYLLQEYGEDVLSFQHLLHLCVFNSVGNNESVIEERISIAEALVQKKREWLEEKEFKSELVLLQALNRLHLYMLQSVAKGGASMEEKELDVDTVPLLMPRVHLRIAQLLVKHGASINAQSRIWGTILHTAGDEGTFSELVRWALSNGFNLVNHKNTLGETPLMYVIKMYKTVDDETFQLLNEAGVDFNAQDYYGNSVLFYAIQHSECCNFVKKLLDFGADPNHRNLGSANAANIIIPMYRECPTLMQNIFTVLRSRGLARFNERIASPEELSSSSVSDMQDETISEDKLLILLFETASNGDISLFHAIRYFKRVDLVRRVIEHGANVNHKNGRDENAAHFVMKYEDDSKRALEVLKLLKLHGFGGLDQKDRYWYTPIMVGMNILNDELLQFFIEEKVNINGKYGYDGESLLFGAIESSKNVSLIRKLLDNGANPNHKCRYGRNAAYFVIKNCEGYTPNEALELLKLLESKGFDGFNHLYNKKSLLDLAKSKGVENEELLNFLRTKAEQPTQTQL